MTAGAIMMLMGALLMLVGAGCRSAKPTMGLDVGAHHSALAEAQRGTTMSPGSPTESAALKRFDDFYAVYSSEAIRSGVRDLYADDAWFGDPFHVVSGIDEIEHYFLAMAEPVESCTFSVDSMQRSGSDYFARWTMVLVSKAAKESPIETIGLSHVRFNSDGKIIFQQDYWDTSVMLDRIPVVGYWTRMVKRRLEKGLTK